MRIVSWNCNGKFREKLREISETEADIFIIQECENPENYTDTEYGEFARNCIWTGNDKNKGLGIFAHKNTKIENNNWNTSGLRSFISVKVNNDFDLIGVWACKPYIEEYYAYQHMHIDKFNDKTILFGDFNSNKIFDKKHGTKNHTNAVKELERRKLISAYHYVYNENQGEEKQPTFYMYRHSDKSFHIDHCFIKKERIKGYRILCSEDWLKCSDHIPIILEI